jgi:acyl-CoA reductase-like NAD-dependent aldehyde dehydrogenase
LTGYPLDALGPDGPYRTRNRETITDAAGAPIAEMSIAPPLFISRTLATQRGTPPLTWSQRSAALTETAENFGSSTVDGLTLTDYVDLTARVSGLPTDVVRAGARALRESLTGIPDAVEAARPRGAVTDWRDAPADGAAVWARRGEVLAVHAPGNAPGVHGLWPQALALGYRVAIRPSRREPFTAHRLVHVLRESGFRETDAVYLSCDHTGANELVRRADLALVYGNREVTERYTGDPTVLTNGPGQTKMLVTAEQDWREHLGLLVDSIAALAGTACVNTTAVLYEGDPAPLARAVAERLAELDSAALPTVTLPRARALAGLLADKAAGTRALLGADTVVEERDDGTAVLHPAVHLLEHSDADRLNVELPFPCVWIAPWSRADGIAALRNSLVVNAITDDDEILDALLEEPTITNVYRGRMPTHHAAAHLPHEGFLADFLMRNKAFARR